MMNREGDAPIGVPVWFEWTGTEVHMFAAPDSPKVGRLAKNPDASVLVTNRIGEPEAWVAFDGRVEVSREGASELIGRLGPKYWDLSDPVKKDLLDTWMAAKDATVLLKLAPARVRSGA